MAPFADRVKLAPGFWTGLRELGIATQDVVRHAQLPLTVIHETFVLSAHYYAIWQAYSELVGDPAAGIVKLVTAFETAQYPPAALATFHALDYRNALHRMARYKRMCPPEGLRIREAGGQCVIELDWQYADQPRPPVLIGITLAYLLELGRRGTGRHLTALSAEFVPSMGHVPALESYFGCRVRTGADCNRQTLNRADLDRPFASYNEELLDSVAMLDARASRHSNHSRRTGDE